MILELFYEITLLVFLPIISGIIVLIVPIVLLSFMTSYSLPILICL